MSPYAYLPMLTHLVCLHTLTYQSSIFYQLFNGSNLEYATQRTLTRVASNDSVSFFPINTFTWPAAATGVVASIARVTAPALQHVLEVCVLFTVTF